MGIYIKDTDIEIRLTGKVRFTDDLEDENKMSRALLKQLIREGENSVERDLSCRYEIPFQGVNGEAFARFTEESYTKTTIKELCRLMGVIKVLDTDFGAGTVVDAEKYKGKLEKRYNQLIERILKKRGVNLGWLYPPLPGMKLAYFNTEADDGYAGMVLNSTSGDGSYPASRINDPSEGWWGAIFEDDGN